MIDKTLAVMRHIPPEALTGLSSGKLKLAGSVIRHANGPIFCHLQEAAPLGQAVAKTAMAAATGGPPMVASQLTLSTTSVVQNEVIRRGVNRVESAVQVMDGKLDVLKHVGVANLALSAAGIGIMVAGFAATDIKLSRIERTVDRLGEDMAKLIGKIEEIRHDQINREFAAIRGLARLFDESFTLASHAAESNWRRVYQNGADLQQVTLERADRHVRTDRDYLSAEPHLESFALISGLRVASLLAAGELETAKRIEREAFQDLDRLTGTIGLSDLVRRALPTDAEPGSEAWHIARAWSAEAMQPIHDAMRQRESLLATRTAVLPTLEAHGIAPREWMQMAREETEAPVLILADKDAGIVEKEQD